MKNLDIKNLFPFYIIEGGLETKNNLEKILNTEVLWREFERFAIEDARNFISENILVNDKPKVITIFTKEIPHDAQNALLKMTEEPVANTHVFFIIPDASQILPTLRSRAQILHDDTNSSIKDAENFMKLKLADKFEWITGFIKKNKEEGESSTLVRTETKKLLESIESILYKKGISKEKNSVEIFETIFKFKSYLATPGASPKMILEHVAMMLS